jgi:hypothetical protein
MVNEVTKVATPSGGLYPAEWLAAEAERLEREHDAIERATARLGEWIQTLTSEASALNDEHMRLLEEVDRVVARRRAHVKRVDIWNLSTSSWAGASLTTRPRPTFSVRPTCTTLLRLSKALSGTTRNGAKRKRG